MNKSLPGALFAGALAAAADGKRLRGAIEQAISALRTADDPYRSLGLATEILTDGIPGCTVGVLLSDPDGLRVAAASSSSLSALVCVDAACAEGPASAAYRSGKTVSCERLPGTRYPAFGPAAAAAGFQSAYGLPIRSRPATLGAMLLLARRPHAFDTAALERFGALTATITDVLSGSSVGARSGSLGGEAPTRRDATGGLRA